MSFKIAAAAALATLASTVSAHGHLQSVGASGTVYAGFNNSILYSNTKPDLIAWSDTVKDNGYVSDYTSPDMICHAGAGNAKLAAPVNGGDTVTFNWDTWPTSHHGPVITYLAKCDGDCADADKTSLKWFKIDAVGIVSGDSNTGTWASDKLIANQFKWDVKIPDSIASGNYVARHEIIALHSANNVGGAQNYPQCINLEVKSSGSDVPEGVVGTELYTAQDKGIFVNIYYPGFQADEYDMPGPALYTGGSGSAPASSAAASSAPASSAAQTTAAYSAPATSSAEATYAPSSAQATTSASSSSAASFTTQAAVVSSAAASNDGYVVTTYQTDVVTQSTAVTVTEGASPTSAPAVSAPAVSAIASAIPSEMLTSTISAGIPTGTASAGVAKPTKALPEGTTLEDLLSWVEYLFAENAAKTASKHRRHARAFHH
ncbi:glycoside hydrolase [Aureobasidium sp. EXF-12298]|nr:glycoside hydrolase [Aureobasidium sp. EXF-12298]KAI4761155.1 glycoside hydrolase [Aureobasidium sp. EXF-12344]KAI4783232.1 glycoside hydrolase [Aureobasidium sp. EXF-3400]